MNTKPNTRLLTGNALAAIIFSLCLIVAGNNSAQASTTVSERVDFSRAMPEENVEDMSVKVLGGSISVNRFYRVMKRNPNETGYPGVSGDLQGYNGNTLQSEAFLFEAGKAKRNDFAVWQFHRRWHDLLFVETRVASATSSGSSSGGSTTGSGPSSGNSSSLEAPRPALIDRNDYLYELKDGEDYYVYEHNGNDLRISITDTGFRWSNRQGDWIDYDEAGLATRSGNKNGVAINLVRENGFITQYKDHFGNTVVTWEYLNGKPVKATDYDGRVVEYKWQGHDLVEVTTTRGHKWKYGYNQIGLNRVMTSKTDPENQTFLYEFQETEGGFQYSTPGSGGPDVTLIGDDTPVAISSGGSSSGSNNQIGFSVPVEPTLMHTAMIYPDGKRVRYQYRYDPQSESYMILQINSDGVESERWFDLDGRVRYSLIGGRVAGTRVRSGLTAVLRDAYGQRTHTRYTRHEAIESITSADGTKVSYRYLPNYNFPVLETDQTGIETKHEYDFKGNLIKTIYGFNTDDQRTVKYDYDLFGQVTVMRYVGRDDTSTTQALYDYDNYGNLIKITDAKGNITQVKNYNSQGQYQTLIDGRGKTWKIAYDDDGNPVTTTTALGFESTYEYDSLHRLKKYTDAELRVTQFEYDSRNHNIKVTNNEEGVQSVKRRMDGLVTETVDESGQVTTYQYDRAARLTSVTDGVGNESQIFYDKQEEVAGRRISQIITPNRTTRLVYDSLYRLVQQTSIKTHDDQITRSTRYEYNARGERTSFTDENGNTTRRTYTPHGEYQTVTNVLDETIISSYDARGNLISVTDPLEKVYRFEYDASDNLTAEFRPMGERRGYTYNANDDQATFTDYNGNVAVYKYDNDSRLIEQTNTKVGASSPERIVAYTFDKSELIKSVTDQNTAATYEYDPVGRLKQQNTNFFTGGLPFTKVLKNTYYKNGQIKTRIDAEGSTTTFAYDGAGKFKQMAIQGAGSIVANAYEGDLIKSMTYPGGITRSYEYDGFARPNRIAVADNAGNLKMDLRYKRDLVGNVLEKTSLEGTFKFGYDGAYRLTSSEQPNVLGNQTFSYDKNGNRTQQTIGEQSLIYSYNDNHELSQIEKEVGDVVANQTFSYDNNGAQINGPTDIGSGDFQFSYNGFGRLRQAWQDGSQLASYSYDSLGRRSAKTLNATGETTYFLYEETGSGLVGEYSADGTLIKAYGYQSESYYSTNPVTVKEMVDGQVEISFFQNDYLGTPQSLLGSNGVTRWQASYSAFGKTSISVSDRSNNVRFSGQYFDAETGLAQNWHRYYGAGFGRYVSSDPIGLSGGINMFGYVGGNPLKFIDPFGLRKLSPERCLQLFKGIWKKYNLLLGELAKYVPADDAIGGFPNHVDGKPTRPGGHFMKIKDYQRGLKKDLKSYHEGGCSDDDNHGGGLPRCISEEANRSIEKPPGIDNEIDDDGNLIEKRPFTLPPIDSNDIPWWLIPFIMLGSLSPAHA